MLDEVAQLALGEELLAGDDVFGPVTVAEHAEGAGEDRAHLRRAQAR
ncbi:MAG: hypothetical protein AB8H86_06575 [Polyangiales bacterium]